MSTSTIELRPPQTTTLLDLPPELHHEIYSYLFEPRWSLVIYEKDEWCRAYPGHVPPYALVGDVLINGPPGCNILLTCRFMYMLAMHRFGRGFSGQMIVGNMRRLGAIAAQLPYGFRKWYKHVRSLQSMCIQDPSDFNMYFTRHFRQLRSLDLMVHDLQIAGIMLSPTFGAFASGLHDRPCLELVDSLVARFYGQHPTLRWYDLRADGTPAASFNFIFRVMGFARKQDHDRYFTGMVVRVNGTTPKVIRKFRRIMKFFEGYDVENSRYMHNFLSGTYPQGFKWLSGPHLLSDKIMG